MRVLVVDDHEVVRRGVRSLLTESDYDVCGEAVDGRDALAKARELKPDVIVMDVSMPVLNGLEATRLIRKEVPGSEVLIMSQHESPAMIREAFKAGARGYVVKSSMGQDLMAALDKVSRHTSFFDPAITEIILRSEHIDAAEILQRSTALEKALQASEELYRTTFDLAGVGIAHVSPDGQWLRVNDRLCKIVGYSEEELLKIRFQEITHPDDLAVDLAETEKLRTGALNNFSMEKRYLRKDGSSVWVQLTVSCARNERGQLTHFISVVEDISARKKAEEALRESQVQLALMAAIVDSSGDAIISKNLDGIVTSWNKAAERIFGYTAKEAVGQSITLIIPTDHRDEEKEILARLRGGERIEHMDTVRQRKGGALLDISLTVSPVRDGTGKVVGASKVARDVTERKQAERTLAERARLLDLSSDAIMVRDGADRITYWNEGASELYGYSREEAMGSVTHELLGTEFPGPMEQVMEELRQNKRWTGELIHRCKGGNRIVVASQWTLDEDGGGRQRCILETNKDITQQKQSETTLRESEERFRALSERLDGDVRARTQELENRNADVLRHSKQIRELSWRLLRTQDEERRHIARELHDSAGQLLAALQMNLTPLEAEAHKLNSPAVVRESIELVEQLSKELRTVSYLLHPPLLDEAGLSSAIRWFVEGFAQRSEIEVQLEVSTEPGRLPQDVEMTLFRIVQESLTNIHRHSGSKKASIRLFHSPEEVSLEIQDHGRGMPVSSNGDSAEGGRVGVGIQGMRERIMQLGGRFVIKSNGSGTTVGASLPLNANVAPVL